MFEICSLCLLSLVTHLSSFLVLPHRKGLLGKYNFALFNKSCLATSSINVEQTWLNIIDKVITLGHLKQKSKIISFIRQKRQNYVEYLWE